MKTDFSIQRINLLLRKDWIENKKKISLWGIGHPRSPLLFPVILHFMGIRDSVPLHYMYWDHWGLLSLSVAT